jgi:hypothetical protein
LANVLLRLKAPFALTTLSRSDGLSYSPIVDLLTRPWYCTGTVGEQGEIDGLGVDWKSHHFCSFCCGLAGWCPVWDLNYGRELTSALVERGAEVVHQPRSPGDGAGALDYVNLISRRDFG